MLRQVEEVFKLLQIPNIECSILFNSIKMQFQFSKSKTIEQKIKFAFVLSDNPMEYLYVLCFFNENCPTSYNVLQCGFWIGV